MTTSPEESPTPPVPQPAKRVAMGRRVFLGVTGLGALGVIFGSSIQNFLGNVFGSGLGGILPGGDRFRIYTITGKLPKIRNSDYRLKVGGLVDRPKTFTLDDLMSMPVTSARPDVPVRHRLARAERPLGRRSPVTHLGDGRGEARRGRAHLRVL